MDYKNRIPGYRPPRPPRRKSRAGLWASLAAASVLIAVAVGWAVTRSKDEPLPPEPPPAKTSEVEVPLPAPSANKPGDKKTAKDDPKAGKKPAVPESGKPAVEAGPPAKPPEIRFTFYKILPELEEIIPESEIKALKREEDLGKKPAVQQYTVQAGSFANAQDAEKLKARLSALRVKSHIEIVKIENTAWNRVKIGPFNNVADADRVRVYLRKNQLDSVVQKAVSPAGGGGAGKPAKR